MVRDFRKSLANVMRVHPVNYATRHVLFPTVCPFVCPLCQLVTVLVQARVVKAHVESRAFQLVRYSYA